MTDMVKAIEKERESRIKVWPCRSNRASEMGHPCLRYLVYNRTAWDKVEIHDQSLQAIFDLGNVHEKEMQIQLMKAGVEIFEQQLSMGAQKIFSEADITLHLDWKVREEDGRAAPVEFKTMSEHIFNSINTYEDLVNSEKSWLRKYPGQMQLYLLGAESDYGYFLLMNKSNGQLKQIKVDLDYEYAESLLKKGKVVSEHVKNDTVPDRIEYDHNLCDRCKHKTTCNPEIPENFSLYFMDKPQFLDKVRRWHEIKPQGEEFKSLDKEVKEILKGTGRLKINLGEFLITCKLSKNGAQRWKVERLEAVANSLTDKVDTSELKPDEGVY